MHFRSGKLTPTLTHITHLAAIFAPQIVGASLLFGLLSGCSDKPSGKLAGDNAAQSTADSFLPANTVASRGCRDGGLLETTLYGALNGDLSWHGDALDCEGMPRPEGRGARLRFAGSEGTSRIAFILSIPDLERAQIANELPSNVTVIEEGIGRFFSTGDFDNCWTDVDKHDRPDPNSGAHMIAGTLYCIAPIAEINGHASVSIDELRFAGVVNWETS